MGKKGLTLLFYGAFKMGQGYYPGVWVLSSFKLGLGVRGLVAGDIFMPRRLLDGNGRRPDAGNRVVKGQEVGLGVVG